MSFNWTKVELKLSGFMDFIEPLKSFNWTKVELKLNLLDCFDSFFLLLIELR